MPLALLPTALDPAFVEPYKTKMVPWGPLGYITYKSRYARWRAKDGTLDPPKELRHHKEEWWECILRCVNGILALQVSANPSAPVLTMEDAERLYDMVFHLKCTFPGRGLWQLGTKYVDRNGQDSLQNCFSGDTEVLTSRGVRRLDVLAVDTLQGKLPELFVYTDDGPQWVTAPVRSFGEQQLWDVHLSDGTVIRATGNHEWFVSRGGKPGPDKITTNHLRALLEANKRPALPLQFPQLPDAFCERGFAHGFTFGDGWRPQTIQVMRVEPCRVEGRSELVFCAQVEKHHNFTLANGVITGNCWGVLCDDPVESFAFLFDELMMGGGVGFNIHPRHVYEMPKVAFNPVVERRSGYDVDLIVADNREGWVRLLKRVLSRFFYTGRNLTFSTDCVRSKGAPIKGFGGTASGPEELVRGVMKVVDILRDRYRKKLRPIDCLDICNIIGAIVVAGNVRRCLAEGSVVQTSRGPVAIENMAPGDEVVTSQGTRQVLRVFDQGVQRTIKITHQAGEIEATPNHRLAVMRSVDRISWVPVDQLKVGDRLCFVSQETPGATTHLPASSFVPSPHAYNLVRIIIPTLDVGMAWFIGVYLGNGYSYLHDRSKRGGSSGVMVACSPDYPTIPDDLAVQLRRFGVRVTIEDNLKDEATVRVRATSRELAEYLRGLKKPHSPITIPEFIRSGTVAVRAAFLAGLFDADGSSRTRPLQAVITVYPTFAKEVLDLYRSLGLAVRSSPAPKCPSRLAHWKPLTQVKVIGEQVLGAFENVVVPYSRKYFLHNKTRRSRHDYGYPAEMINGDIRYGRRWTKQSSQMTVAVMERCLGQKIHLIPTAVVAVDEGRTVHTYDLEVEGNHQFMVEGCLSHNSAQIALGKKDDIDYLIAKTWSTGSIPPHRGMSNNSVLVEDIDDLPQVFWDGYTGDGEPYGMVNLHACQNYGRLIDGKGYRKDPRVIVVNPCQPRWATVLTRFGIRTIENLRVGDEVWSGKSWTRVVRKVETGQKDVFAFRTRAGTFYGTDEHLVVSSGVKVAAREATTIDSCPTEWSDAQSISHEIISREWVSNEMVYDITVGADEHTYWTDGLLVSNCGEIPLENYESCNLWDVVFPNCTDEEFIQAVELGYKVTKIISTVPAIHDKTNEVLQRNRRLGIGVTGLLQDRERFAKKELFEAAYRRIEELDRECSHLLGVNQSVKLTTVKPSGTVSLLPGVTPGVHPAYSRYYIRRINLSTDSPLVKVCREHGYNIEPRIQLDGSRDLNTMVVEFPVRSPDSAVLAKDVTAIEQLEFAQFMQTWWSDNSVSVTVYYRLEELEEIRAWLKEHWTNGMKTVSFLLHSEHGFKQAPYEEISKERYEELAAKTRMISRVEDQVDGDYEIDDPECRGGVCPVR